MDNQVIDKICSFAFAMAVIGVCTIGICPAFGIMSLAVHIVFKRKGVELTPQNNDKMKKSKFLAVASLIMFLIDLAILFFVFK